MPTTVPGLQTRLKLWQARGKEKLKVLAQFSFKGGLWNYDQRPTTVPGLQTTLRLWQARGKEKLKVLAKSIFKGGFLCDPVGLGKSLTALTAALESGRACFPIADLSLSSVASPASRSG